MGGGGKPAEPGPELGQSPKEKGLHLTKVLHQKADVPPPYSQQVPSTYRQWFKFFAYVTAHGGLRKAP